MFALLTSSLRNGQITHRNACGNCQRRNKLSTPIRNCTPPRICQFKMPVALPQPLIHVFTAEPSVRVYDSYIRGTRDQLRKHKCTHVGNATTFRTMFRL
eukprot:165623-Prorocentrum_minimum.AAC.4